MRVVLGDVLDGVVGAVAKGRPPSHCSLIPLTQLVDFPQVYTMRIYDLCVDCRSQNEKTF